MVKYGASLDRGLLNFMEQNIDAVRSREPDVLAHICAICYRLKAGIVERDPNDTKNIRIVLNYGHTIGHAVESASKYAYTHGESIAIGMACANDIACALGILPTAVRLRVESILTTFKLPTRIKNCRLDDILGAMRNDKKFVHGKNRFVLLTSIGSTRVVESVPDAIIRTAIKQRMVT